MTRYRLKDGKKIKFTAEEETAKDAEEKLFKEEQKKFIEKQEKKQENKISAITKLKNLGLTDDEINALIGQ